MKFFHPFLVGLFCLGTTAAAYASQWFYASGTGSDQYPEVALANAQNQAHNNLEHLCDIWKGDLSKEETTSTSCQPGGSYTYCTVQVKGYCDY